MTTDKIGNLVLHPLVASDHYFIARPDIVAVQLDSAEEGILESPSDNGHGVLDLRVTCRNGETKTLYLLP